MITDIEKYKKAFEEVVSDMKIMDIDEVKESEKEYVARKIDAIKTLNTLIGYHVPKTPLVWLSDSTQLTTCPECGGVFDDENRPDYCPICGQRIEWRNCK